MKVITLPDDINFFKKIKSQRLFSKVFVIFKRNIHFMIEDELAVICNDILATIDHHLQLYAMTYILSES